MFRKIFPYLFLLVLSLPCFGQGRLADDFKEACDSLSVLMLERTGVQQQLNLRRVVQNGDVLDFYFDHSLGDFPLRKEDCAWFRSTLKSLFPPAHAQRKVGEIYSAKEKMSDLAVAGLNFDGRPIGLRYRKEAPAGRPIVSEIGGPRYETGLSGRHLALWPSHGLYYDRAGGRWRWQRAILFSTVEDLFSTSFVLPYLVPMLENAGAYVMMPRERDTNPVELIVDNDYCPTSRHGGVYTETGRWEDAGEGFADLTETYCAEENPFHAGTARSAVRSASGVSRAVWSLDIPERGRYAVYVSYKTVPGSVKDARYTVRHLGGVSSFSVNQTMGGGTWIYLGTFDFDKGTSHSVELDTWGEGEGVVTADAVKVGGGVGNIAAGPKDDPSAKETSGMPRYVEAARYWLQWAGIDPSVYSQFESEDDYRDDLFSRGDWVDLMSGGSQVNPDVPGKGVPFDLTLGFHTDAGTTPNDSTIGSLVIYSRLNEWKKNLPDGEDRRTNREFADIVQSQIVNDLRSGFDPIWERRQIWDRAYRETRTPPVPTILTESLSHQNFADMRLALDPSFKFTLSRAIYKGLLKYLSGRYGCPYEVQPLPVKGFAAVPAGGDTLRLSWLPRVDSIEATAVPAAYILYTRIDDGAFDKGAKIVLPSDGGVLSGDFSVEDALSGNVSGGVHSGDFSGGVSPDGPQPQDTADGREYIVARLSAGGRVCVDVPLTPGRIYSFKVTAVNGGGESFPSEILCAGLPKYTTFADGYVAVLNDFTRVSAPAWYDSPQYAGFNIGTDSGVPYVRDIAYTGEMYNNDRSAEWITDENSGFGASFNDRSGHPVAGNSFDFAYVHGKAFFHAGMPFCSLSAEAFASSASPLLPLSGSGRPAAVDIICGKQVTTPRGNASGVCTYTVFPEGFRKALSAYASAGGSILISGSYIGTDIWDRVYPIETDEKVRESAEQFAEKVLGFRWLCNNGGRSGELRTVSKGAQSPGDSAGSSSGSFSCTANDLKFNTDFSETVYRVDAPDGLGPAGKGARVIFRYSDTGIPAGVSFTAPDGHRAVCAGFPLETLVSDGGLEAVVEASLKFFGL